MDFASRLNKRVKIEKLVDTTDDIGQPAKVWETVCTVWASVEPIGGKEFFSSDRVNSEITVRITIRYKTGITADMSILHEGRRYMIASPPIDFRSKKESLQLMCKEVQNG